MPTCVRLKRKKRKVCLGDLNEMITLQDRALTAVNSGVDASETFTNALETDAMIETVRGITVFDGTGTEVDATHVFTIQFEEGISAETWILFEDRRFDILDTQDYEERHEYLRLVCANRGTIDNRAGDA